MMMIWRLLWCIELPTEIRRQIKVRAWNESESTRAEAKTRVVHGLLCECVCARTWLFVWLLARKGTMVYSEKCVRCIALLLRIYTTFVCRYPWHQSLHQLLSFNAALYLFHRLGRFIDVFTLFCGLCKYCLCAFPFNLTKQQNKTK